MSLKGPLVPSQSSVPGAATDQQLRHKSVTEHERQQY